MLLKEIKKNTSIPLLILYILLSRIFVYRGIDWNGGLGEIFYLFLGCLMIFCSKTVQNNCSKGSIYNSVLALTIWFLCSILVGFFLENQSFYYSLRGLCSFSYAPILLYFLLHNKQYDNRIIIGTLLSLFVVYLFIYGYSYMIFPNYRFGMVSDIDEGLLYDFETRGVFRTGIPYEDLIAIFFFYVVSNDKINAKKRFLLFFILLFLTIIRGTRFLIAGTLFVSVLLYMKQAKGNILKYTLCLAIIILSLMMYIEIFGIPPFIENYIELSDKDQDSGNDNIRIVMSMYYLFDFNSSLPEILFGHGIPVNSDFSMIKEKLTQYGFFADDVGYIEFYLNFGVVGILLLLGLLYSVIKTKVPRDFLFAKYYIYYIFITMLCGRYFLNNIVLIVTMLYLIENNKIILNKKTIWKR